MRHTTAISIALLCVLCIGCDGQIPGWPKTDVTPQPQPHPVPPVNPVTPVNPDAVVIVSPEEVGVVKPTNELGLAEELPKLFAEAGVDQVTMKNDALALAAMYAQLADMIYRDGQTTKQYKKTDDLLECTDAAKNFMVKGTSIDTMIRKYKSAGMKIANTLIAQIPGQLDLTDERRATAVDTFRAISWGCWQTASK